MTLQELWTLFPIILTDYNPDYPQWYIEETTALQSLLHFPVKYSHIGSTAVPGIQSKPIIDILMEFSSLHDLETSGAIMEQNGYIVMSKEKTRMSLNKGYTLDGYADRVFHFHLRLLGDNDEIYFRDYLISHPEIKVAYEDLKLSLSKTYKYDRDAYTLAKTDFIKKYTALSKNK